MPRGGYREKGAFKKGNLAALKHGRYSKNIQELLKESPDGRILALDKKVGLRIFQLVPKEEK